MVDPVTTWRITMTCLMFHLHHQGKPLGCDILNHLSTDCHLQMLRPSLLWLQPPSIRPPLPLFASSRSQSVPSKLEL